MELVTLPLLFLSLLGFQPSSGVPAAASDGLFVSGRAADSVLLRRHRRHNTGVFEEWLQGDMERECVEELCDLEEAREIFEDDDKTMEFWAGYIDGNQCKSHPCLNQGTCKDLLGAFSCSCAPGFTGTTCEIALAKRCDVNNGDCQHFCQTMGTFGAKCSCASGYRLMEDGVTCDPEVEFPCGITALAAVGSVSRRSLIGHLNSTLRNASALLHGTDTTPPTSPPPPPPSSSAPPSTAQSLSYTAEAATAVRRIVGGRVVIPGEIPWQAALVYTSSGEIFCGGSILHERWVVTAAHCLAEVQAPFFVRVGEYNVHLSDGTEQDYQVMKQHLHPRYNSSRSLYNHDIALLHLSAPVAFSATVRPICIGPRSFTEALVKRTSPATVSGWGRTRFLGATASTLQKVEVPYVSRTECKRSSSSRITPVMFCAGYYDREKDACQGDSGGPHANNLHDTWFLTGIVSWGEECAKDGKYGVYTRVSLYHCWINHVMGLTPHGLEVEEEEEEEDNL